MSKPQTKSELFTCEALFDLLDLAQETGVPFRVEYNAEEGDVCATIGVENFEVTRAAEAIGFGVSAGERLSGSVRRAREAYLRSDDPGVVSAVKERLLAEGAPVAEGGSMAIEFEPEPEPAN